MQRKIIEIDETLCDGCGDCVTGCAEGALQVIDGKARVVKESFCDGLGACIGDCPQGALRVVERQADAFDASAVEAHLVATRGREALAAFHAQQAHHHGGGCPGSAVRMPAPRAVTGPFTTQAPPHQLQQWPVQLHLVPPTAPFFQDKELVVLATCAPVASTEVHQRFLRDRSMVVACPKLDQTSPYVDKLAGILSHNTIPRVLVVRMEVPCCGGLLHFVHAARQKAGAHHVPVDEIIIGIDGQVRAERAAPPAA